MLLDFLPARDDAAPASATEPPPSQDVARGHLKGLLEALVFVSDKPIKASELAKSASAPAKEIRELLVELREEYAQRGVQLDEVAGGWIFRTNPQYAPFVRDLTKQRPVKLTRAQVETLAILAYRQPITRPEIDDIRGVDSGATLKLLLERDLVKILGKKDEPGRPLLYGTTPQFLEFFGLKSLKDLPTLREFTELNEDSRRVVERELGDVLEAKLGDATEAKLGDATEAKQGDVADAKIGDVADGEGTPEPGAEAAPSDEPSAESAEPPSVRDTLPPAAPEDGEETEEAKENGEEAEGA